MALSKTGPAGGGVIEIDGGRGEGGGQILRTALALSCLFREPFRIAGIRKGRERPGLMPQHLAAVRAAQRLGGADVEGDRPGSTGLVFAPREARSGDYAIDVGTAGSAVLVLQTLLPALVFAPGESTIAVTGGTHVPFSPSFDYMAEVFAPLLSRLGVGLRLDIERYGFYPRGGGAVRAVVSPARAIRPLRVLGRGKVLSVTGISGVGNLPMAIAERQRDAALEAIRTSAAVCARSPEIRSAPVPAAGQGTFLFLKCEGEDAVAGFCALGARGKKAEAVGGEAVSAFLDYHATGAALDPYLPDQLALYLALCPEESVFTTSRLTPHLLTNLWVIGLFRDFAFSVEGEVGKPGLVRLRGEPRSGVRPP